MFFVEKTKKLINYKLNLLKNAKIFLVFYILLLRLANLIMFLQDIFYFYLQKKQQFEIEKTFIIKKSKVFY